MKPGRIRLPAAWREALRAAADAAYPDEACGLILGRAAGWAADELVPCANVADAPRRRFEIDPTVLLHCYKTLRGTERAVIGVYHSHPDGTARPSPTDAARAWDKALVWLVIAGDGGRAGAITAWQPTGDGFARLELHWT